jgi:hypothetical protein
MRIVAVADTHTFQDDLRTIPDGDVFFPALHTYSKRHFHKHYTITAFVLSGQASPDVAGRPDPGVAILPAGGSQLRQHEPEAEAVRSGWPLGGLVAVGRGWYRR